MSAAAWSVCAIWLAGALGVALVRGGLAVRRGHGRDALRRARSPTVILFAAAADERPAVAVRLGLAVLFGGAVFAAAAVILAVVSPAFVPRWLQ